MISNDYLDPFITTDVRFCRQSRASGVGRRASGVGRRLLSYVRRGACKCKRLQRVLQNYHIEIFFCDVNVQDCSRKLN